MTGRIPTGRGGTRGLWWNLARLTTLLVLLGGWFALESGAQTNTATDASGPASTSATAPADSVTKPTSEAPPEPVANSLMGRIRMGGPMLVPVGACSFLLVVFIFERLISLRRGRVIPRPFVRRFLHQLREGQLDVDEALELCDANGSPIADVFAAAVKKWGRPATEVEQAVLDAGERVTHHLRKYLRLFNGIYTVTPLMGLLGTVFGMIHSFDKVASMDAMGRAELLAHGISEALISTAAGLVVAIPALITYLYFVGRVDSLTLEIDELGQQVVNGVAVDGWKEKKKTRPKPAAAKPAAKPKAA